MRSIQLSIWQERPGIHFAYYVYLPLPRIVVQMLSDGHIPVLQTCHRTMLYFASCGRSEAPGCACVAISQSSDKPGFDSGRPIRTRFGYARAPVRMVAKREQMSDPTEKNDLT